VVKSLAKNDIIGMLKNLKDKEFGILRGGVIAKSGIGFEKMSRQALGRN